jgi:hypothetical protein
VGGAGGAPPFDDRRRHPSARVSPYCWPEAISRHRATPTSCPRTRRRARRARRALRRIPIAGGGYAWSVVPVRPPEGAWHAAQAASAVGLASTPPSSARFAARYCAHVSEAGKTEVVVRGAGVCVAFLFDRFQGRLAAVAGLKQRRVRRKRRLTRPAV